jgi:hypothetical protein
MLVSSVSRYKGSAHCILAFGPLFGVLGFGGGQQTKIIATNIQV